MIQHLADFLLELGDDSAFVGRQRRPRIDDTWFRVDLVLFHRRLRCLVIIDLKVGRFSYAPNCVVQPDLYYDSVKPQWGKAWPGGKEQRSDTLDLTISMPAQWGCVPEKARRLVSRALCACQLRLLGVPPLAEDPPARRRLRTLPTHGWQRPQRGDVASPRAPVVILGAPAGLRDGCRPIVGGTSTRAAAHFSLHARAVEVREHRLLTLKRVRQRIQTLLRIQCR